MSALVQPTSCIRCLRRLGWSAELRFERLADGQWRGKKKSTKGPPTIPIRLVRDLRGFGPRGTIIEIAQGRMRNQLYPRGFADYIPKAEQAAIKHLIVDRNPSFLSLAQPSGINDGLEEQNSDTGTIVQRSIDLLSPKETKELLERLLPARITFHRRPIQAEAQTLSEIQESASQGQAEVREDDTEILQPEQVSEAAYAPIFGSVSTLDIAQNYQSIIAEFARSDSIPNASRAVIETDTITILPNSARVDAVEGDRIKSLGAFKIILRVKGLQQEESLRRTVVVAPTEEFV